MSAKIPVSPQIDLRTIPPINRIVAFEVAIELQDIADIHEVHGFDPLVTLFHAMDDTQDDLLNVSTFGLVAFFSAGNYIVRVTSNFLVSAAVIIALFLWESDEPGTL